MDGLEISTLRYPEASSTIVTVASRFGRTIWGTYKDQSAVPHGFVAFAVETIRGDLNADGKVDLTDFGIFKENFGKSGAAGVPEPSGLALAWLGGALALATWRARRSRRQRRESFRSAPILPSP